MTAQEAYMATQKGLAALKVRRDFASDQNLQKLLEHTIPYAASQGYGSLRIDANHLTEGARTYLKTQMGYRVKYDSGGEYGSPSYKLEWDRKSPKQNLWQSELAATDRLDPLPN